MYCIQSNVEKQWNYCRTVWKNEKFTGMPRIFFSSNQFMAKFFSKTLIWRNFCGKTVAVKFRNFHSVCRRLKYISWNQFSTWFISQKVVFTKFLRKIKWWLFIEKHDFTKKLLKSVKSTINFSFFCTVL